MSQATARVNVTLRVELSSTWGPDCTVAQVHKQAYEEALALLRQKLCPGLHIEGTPEVVLITYPIEGHVR